MGDSRIHAVDWLERKISSVTGEFSFGVGFWNLLEKHLGSGRISNEELSKLQFENLDLCFECFFLVCCQKYSWDSQLLHDGFLLADHKDVREMLQGINIKSGDWYELFLEFIRQDTPYRINVVVGEDIERRSRVLDELEELGVTSYIACEVIEWYEDFRDEPIEFEEFLELVVNGYRSIDDLKLLEHDINKKLYELKVPPLASLQRISGGIDRFFIMNDKIERVLPWFGDLELDVRIEEIAKTLDLGITEECFDSIDETIRRELGDNAYLVYDEDEEESGFAPFLSTLEALEAVGLPISDANVSRYFGMSSASILFAIDNELSDEKYFACARLFDEVSDIHKGVSILEICQDLQATCDLVEAGANIEIVHAVEARGVSVTALTELVKKEPQFPCAALLLWLDAGFEADSLDEMLEWWRAGFTPDNVASWRELGFDALEATAWLRQTSDPVVAWRRKEAGISPTKK